MGFSGQGPKANRQRRSAPVRGDWVDLTPLKEFILPLLSSMTPPSICEDGEWPFTSQAYWSAWRESPVTAKWSKDDIALAIDTIYGHAEAAAGGRGIPPSETRLRQESLGLTPKGRVDRRWRLPDEKPDAEVVALHVASDSAPRDDLPEPI